jgi:cytochrome c-type biogenesis protein CcmH
MVFSLIGIALIAMALALILPPLRHSQHLIIANSTSEANVMVYRRQLEEMATSVRHQLMTDEQFQRDRDELERRLIGDLPAEPPVSRTARREPGALVLGYALMVGLPVMAVVLYLLLGMPSLALQLP